MGMKEIVQVEHHDPFSLLGMHPQGKGVVVRAHLPWAVQAWVAGPDARRSGPMTVNADGLFEASFAAKPFAYCLKTKAADGAEAQFEDPYRFGPVISEEDLYLWNEGTCRRAYSFLGAHPRQHQGVQGTSFAVWAPAARRVSVVGDWNGWDGRVHPMRARGASGVWELFIPEVNRGAHYKYEIKTQGGELLVKADPFAFRHQTAPGTASLVWGLPERSDADRAWMEARRSRDLHAAPFSVYEVHLGSWARVHAEGNRSLSYLEHARRLAPYVADLGFTHIELMPVMEHPFEGSWGYQVTGFYAVAGRWGTPEEFLKLVETCHEEGIGVILDWVPSHFPTDAHALARYDGTALYEHEDPRQGFQPDWGTLVFNYGRKEVKSFLISNALYWLETFHIDGLRLDAVASMLYLDYSRKPGEWIPNRYGGNENLDAVEFLRHLNSVLYEEYPGATTIAEESTAWPGVSRPAYAGGLGFGFKWNMGWMHDTLTYFSKDPVHRKFHHDNLTFPLLYAFTENFQLVLSHDEVVHLKGSLLAKMPGDDWQKFANLRLLFGYMFAEPGKKLLFMGSEFAQGGEWSHDGELEWHLLGRPQHAGIKRLMRDLLHFYRETPALWRRDTEPRGFCWIDFHDVEQGVVSFLRRGDEHDPPVLAAFNLTPVPRVGYRLGAPQAGFWAERLNTDAKEYGGSGMGNYGGVQAVDTPLHSQPASLELTLPPLAAVYLAPRAP